MDFTKTQKSRHLENETLSFLQIKKSLITHEGLLYGKNTFVAEVTFKKLTFYGIEIPETYFSRNQLSAEEL